jgi:hypothetical protein
MLLGVNNQFKAEINPLFKKVVVSIKDSPAFTSMVSAKYSLQKG